MYTSTKEHLSLEEVLHLGVVVLCVRAQPGASVPRLGPVNFGHTPQEDSERPQLHVSLQIQHHQTGDPLPRVKHRLVFSPHNLETS